MLGTKRWQTVAKILFAFVSIVLITVSWGHVDTAHAAFWGRSRAKETPTTVKTTGKIAEASPPIALQELRQVLDVYQPQVKMISPRKNEVLTDNTVSVRFLVNDLPLFKHETFGLGPHLHVLLDNRAYQAVYDISQPLVFDNLEPGTHTIRAFASRPWHESFKNDGAFAQTTFHVFTKTQDNSPNPELPLLTYSRPQGTYGAEPILLDFYLTNAPLHFVAQADAADDIADWRIRCTVNGDSFVIDRWQPLYLKGFKPGKNWVQLEYLDEQGNPVPNVYNNTVRIIDYQPNGDDTLAKLVRGELSAADLRGIVDPNYVPPVTTPTAEPSPESLPTPSPESLPTPSPESLPEPSPEPLPESSSEPSPEPSPSPLETLQSEPSSSLNALERTPDRSIPIAPSPPEPLIGPSPELSPAVILPTPEPSPKPSLEPSSTPSESATSPDGTKPPSTIAPPKPPAATAQKPVVLDRAPVPKETQTDANAISGQERLRQVQQRFSQYLSLKKAIAPNASSVPTVEGDRATPPVPTSESAQPTPATDPTASTTSATDAN